MSIEIVELIVMMMCKLSTFYDECCLKHELFFFSLMPLCVQLNGDHDDVDVFRKVVVAGSGFSMVNI